MSNTFVFVESSNGQIKSSSQELLNWGRTNSDAVTAMLVGEASDELVNQCAHFGAGKVITCGDEKLLNYNPEVFTNLLCAAIQEHASGLVLASASSLAKDLFPRVAARLDSAVASDCVGLSNEGGEVKAHRPMYAGKCFADAVFADSKFQFVLMRPNQLPTGEADSSKTAEKVSMESPAADNLATTIKEIVKGTSEKLDLTEANIIVSGGRGLKGAENFKLLEELADVLGATVGASRAVVDAGWVPHSMQVGQTGKTVGPSLYIAVGISGAIQHLAGMSSSKVIVAINQDADAPIFQKASYGIVGDLFDVVPKLTEEFKKLLN